MHPYSRASMASAFSNQALSLNGALGLSKSSGENFLKHPRVGVFGNEAAQVYELVGLVVFLAGCCNLQRR